MRTIAIYNQKGGVGKTTTTVNLAAGLAELGRRVLVIDADPQGNASMWFGMQFDDVAGVLVGNRGVAESIRPTGVVGVSIVSGGGDSASAERVLSAKKAGGDRVLRRKLREIEGRGVDQVGVSVEDFVVEFDYVLIDCPPSLGLLTVNALLAADGVIVPVEAHTLSLAGLAAIRETLETLREEAEHDVCLDGVLICRYSGRTRHGREIAEEIREHFGGLVFRTVIRENIRLAEAVGFGKPITEYAPRSKGAEDYRSLAAEMVGKV